MRSFFIGLTDGFSGRGGGAVLEDIEERARGSSS